MKSKAFLNKVMAIMTAVMVVIQPSTAFASTSPTESQTTAQNPTEASAKVKYEGVDAYYSIVVPTSIQLDENGEATFNLRAEGELRGWKTGQTDTLDIFIPILVFTIYSEDEEGTRYPGCYLKQDGREPIFAEFHEEADTICNENIMEQEGIKNYKDIKRAFFVKFCNPLPTWVRNLTAEELEEEEYRYLYEGMDKEQFSHFWFGYDMGTSVPITVNLEGNKTVPAGKWEGKIVIDITDSVYLSLSKDVCQEAQEAYDEIIANK